MARACETCHARKVKCDLPISSTPEARCSNCVDANIHCRRHVRKRRHAQISDDTLALPESSFGQNAIASEEQSQRRKEPSPVTAAPWVPSLLPSESPQTPRPSFLGRSDYITSTDLAIDEDDAMQYETPGTDTRLSIAAMQAKMVQSAFAIGFPHQSLKESLIKSFLERGKVWMPVVSQSDLLLAQPQGQSSLLLTAVLVAGSKLSTAPHALEWGEKCYFYAKTLFSYGIVQSTLQLITATVLLQWWNPSGPEHVSLESSSLWLRIGVGLAHQFGLHREPDPRSADVGLRRRLWWTIVTRDNQIATSHGRPRALNPDESNVRPLRPGDFDEPEHPDTLLFIHFVCINSILGDIAYHCRCGSLSAKSRLDIETRLLQWINALPSAFHLYNRSSWTLEPYDSKSRQLHVQFLVALIILYRFESPSQSFSLISLKAASLVLQIFEEFIDWGDIMFLAPPFVFYLLVAGLAQIYSHRYPELAQNAEAEIRTIRFGLRELKKRFPTAYGAERIFENLLRKAQAMRTNVPKFPTTLSSFQQELLQPFGPEVCASWSTEPIIGAEIPKSGEHLLPTGGNIHRTRSNSLPQVDVRVSTGMSSDHIIASQEHTTTMESGQGSSTMQIPQPMGVMGEYTFGGLDSWFVDWTVDTIV